MSSTLALLTGRRAWFVPAVSISGDLSAETIDSVATEMDDNATRIVFQQFAIGGQPQVMTYASLTDHRGNPLPATIDSPVVIPIRKNSVDVAILGRPTNVAFQTGKAGFATEDGLVDLWIVEAGA